MTKAEKIDVPKGNVHARLSEARQRFHALELKKSGKNTFAGYSYFELGDFVIPALKVFHDCGLCAVISFSADTASMRIVMTDFDSEFAGETEITITSPMGSASLKGCHEVQNIGAVETYQRRYLWMAALEIVEHDALDAGAEVGQSQEGEASPSAPKNWGGRYPTKTALKKAMHTHHAELERLGNEATFDDLEDYLTSPEYKDYIQQASEHAPAYLEGPLPDNAPPEFIQTFKLEQRARDLIAMRSNQPMEKETA